MKEGLSETGEEAPGGIGAEMVAAAAALLSVVALAKSWLYVSTTQLYTLYSPVSSGEAKFSRDFFLAAMTPALCDVSLIA